MKRNMTPAFQKDIGFIPIAPARAINGKEKV